MFKTTLLVVGIVAYAAARPAMTFCTIGLQAADSGSSRIDTAGVQMRGCGAGIDKKTDNVLFAYGNPAGDFDIEAYCTLIDDTAGRTETGLMVRTDTSADAACIALLILHERGMAVTYRTSDGSNAKSVVVSSTVYNYLRLQRRGNSFFIYCKFTAGGSWTQMGSSYRLSWPSAVCAGVVHSSGEPGQVTVSRYDTVNGLPEEGAAPSPCEPLLYDFEGGAPLATLGFREIDRWVPDTGKYIRTDLSDDSLSTAHILTPSFVTPLGTDTVSASWDLFFDGDTTTYLYDYGLFSQEQLSLNDRAKITAPRIGSAAKVVAGIDDTLYGNIFASDSVVAGDRSKVYGNVTTGTYCRLINGAAVYGTVSELAAYAPPVVPVYTVDTGTVTLTVNANDSLDCVPGNYATLTAYANAKIRFRSGIYQFSRLICHPDVKLYMATDSSHRITIKVRDSLQLADRSTMIMSGPSVACRNVRVYTHQTRNINFGADLRLYGYFIAPNAEAHLVSRGTNIDGGLYAKKISFEPDVAITVNRPDVNNDQFIASLQPGIGSQPVYSIRVLVHRSTLRDTMTDIIIKRDTVTVATVKTGAPTPLKKWLSLQVRIFKDGVQNRLRLLYNNGTGTSLAVDTLPLAIDTLTGIAFDYRKNGFVNPVAARLDNIALSCAADTCSPVVIVTQPADDTVYEDKPVTFFCGVDAGAFAPAYQWYRSGMAIPFANLPGYSIGSARMIDNGASFYCRISGPCDTASTNPAYLTVLPCEPPVISAQPLDDTVNLGGTAVFSAMGQGDSLSYVWKRNDDTIDGANSPTYTVSPVQSFNNLDRYRVVIRNGCGQTSQSRNALLTIPDVSPCRITGQPVGDTLIEGDYYLTGIRTVCEGGVYEWYRNGVPVSGATAAQLIYGPVSLTDNGMDFCCVVTDGITSDTSAVVRLVVRTIAAMGGSISISGELFDGKGNPAGTADGSPFDFTAMLYTRKTGGTPVYTERFKDSTRAVIVKNGAFTLTLGRGAATGAGLQKVVAAHKDLYVELYAGKNGGMELIAPRLHLTAAPYAFTAGVKVIYGSGSPVAGAISAPLGAMYVDRSDSDRTWKLAGTGWVPLE